ncbi:hypothetical protein BCR44DRAFT_69985 [Catenaria anguillulae PL171]|uniref:Ankyrin repeat-containing domain protein n=1 Tax=Catenaria anguillulae PL171 TaxID=765915 RepID=A0A1Y2I2S0_9FUNG|nr:hypothetical protein BCR44DRAFT_69985 [Catenaria anguillulae PL171]
MNTTTMDTFSNPTNPIQLTVELIDNVLVYAMRLHVGTSRDYRRQSHELHTIHTLLTAMHPESHRRDVIRAAIMSAWWMDLDWASKRRQLLLFDSMAALHGPGCRPVQFSKGGLDRAASLGFFNVVKWWYARHDEHVLRLPDVSAAAFGKGLARIQVQEQAEFDLAVVWAVSRFGDSFLVAMLETIIDSAITQGQKRILEYLAPHLVSNPAQSKVTYETFCLLARAAGKNKRAWAIEWIAQHLCQFIDTSLIDPNLFHGLSFRTALACHHQAFLGSLASGDLEWVQRVYAQWKRSCPPFTLTGDLTLFIAIASEAGHLQVIQWMVGHLCNACDSLEIDVEAIALNGHAHVLEWWSTTGVHLIQGTKLIPPTRPNMLYLLTKRGWTLVVQWWVTSSGMSFEAGETPIVVAAKYGNIELLTWWDNRLRSEGGRKNRGCPRFTLVALEQASACGHVHVLDWWVLNNKPFPECLHYGPFDIVKRACRAGRLGVVQWWCAHMMKSTDSSSLCIWTDKNCMLQLIQESQGTQLDVFDWLDELWARMFGKPAKLHMNNMAVIHPLLAHVYRARGFELSLSRHAQRLMVRKCIRKGYVLVLHDLMRWGIVGLDSLTVLNHHGDLHKDNSSFDCRACVNEWIWGTSRALFEN